MSLLIVYPWEVKCLEPYSCKERPQHIKLVEQAGGVGNRVLPTLRIMGVSVNLIIIPNFQILSTNSSCCLGPLFLVLMK